MIAQVFVDFAEHLVWYFEAPPSQRGPWSVLLFALDIMQPQKPGLLRNWKSQII